MRRFLLAALGLATVATGVSAQNVTLGAKAGYSLGDLADVQDITQQGAFAGGGFVSIGFGNMFLAVEGLYAQRKVESSGVASFTQDVVEIPATIGKRLAGGLVQPKLYLGAAAAFESKCSVDAITMPLGVGNCATLDTKSAVWSAVFGGGLDISLGLIVITTDIRYNLGLTTINDSTDAKWNTWMLLAGLGFRLGA